MTAACQSFQNSVELCVCYIARKDAVFNKNFFIDFDKNMFAGTPFCLLPQAGLHRRAEDSRGAVARVN